MSAVLAVCVLLWPMVLLLAVGRWFDRRPDVADRWAARIAHPSHSVWSKRTDPDQLFTTNNDPTTFKQSEQNDYFTRESFQ